MEAEKIYAVIMAGGRGTRFWPASVKVRPKQFMNLLGGGTMIQLTAGRFRNITGPDRIVVVTGASYEAMVLEQLPLLKRQNLLLEPTGRNTAACIGWAAETLRRRGEENSVMIVAASDHMIKPLSGFESTVKKAVSLAEKGYLCTIGIPPEHPATGYGYLQKGEMLSPGWSVKSFKEKPDAVTARKYLESGEFFWNSGMFVWKTGVFLDEMKKFMPQLMGAIEELPDTASPPLELYGALESQSVDYGVMELTERAVMVPAEFSWSDIGDWPGAKNAGVGRGRSILLDSSNTMVFDETGRLTVIVGINDACVISTETATLVMADSSSQNIKKVVEELDSEMPDLV